MIFGWNSSFSPFFVEFHILLEQTGLLIRNSYYRWSWQYHPSSINTQQYINHNRFLSHTAMTFLLFLILQTLEFYSNSSIVWQKSILMIRICRIIPEITLKFTSSFGISYYFLKNFMFYTGPFVYLLPCSLGASKVLDVFGIHVSVWKKFVISSLINFSKCRQVHMNICIYICT